MDKNRFGNPPFSARPRIDQRPVSAVAYIAAGIAARYKQQAAAQAEPLERDHLHPFPD